MLSCHTMQSGDKGRRGPLTSTLEELEARRSWYFAFVQEFSSTHGRSPMFIEMPLELAKYMGDEEFRLFSILSHDDVLEQLDLTPTTTLDWSGDAGVAQAKRLIKLEFEHSGADFPSKLLLRHLKDIRDHIDTHDPFWWREGLITLEDLIIMTLGYDYVEVVLRALGIWFDDELGVNRAVHALNAKYLSDPSTCPDIMDLKDEDAVLIRIQIMHGKWNQFTVKSLYDLYRRTIVPRSLIDMYILSYIETKQKEEFEGMQEIHRQFQLFMNFYESFQAYNNVDPSLADFPQQLAALYRAGKFKAYDPPTLSEAKPHHHGNQVAIFPESFRKAEPSGSIPSSRPGVAKPPKTAHAEQAVQSENQTRTVIPAIPVTTLHEADPVKSAYARLGTMEMKGRSGVHEVWLYYQLFVETSRKQGQPTLPNADQLPPNVHQALQSGSLFIEKLGKQEKIGTKAELDHIMRKYGGWKKLAPAGTEPVSSDWETRRPIPVGFDWTAEEAIVLVMEHMAYWYKKTGEILSASDFSRHESTIYKRINKGQFAKQQINTYEDMVAFFKQYIQTEDV